MKIVLYSLAVCAVLCLQGQSDPHVLLVSFDGFRYDYVAKYETPNFDSFIEGGTAAAGLIPSFPSKTFPNHYTLVTGLYPGNHGLVDNKFYDREKDVTYVINNRELVEDPDFYGGLPLWQLVQQNGLKSASYFWVGSEAPVKGRFPDYYYRYDSGVPNEQRIAQVEEWLILPDSARPRFITLYFSFIDSEGHRSGPDSEATGKAVNEADRLLGMIMETVEKSGQPVNVIVTSDHGMVAIKNEVKSYLRLDQMIDLDRDGMKTVISDTHAQFYFEDPDDIVPFYHELKKLPEIRVFLKNETPIEWKFRKHKRIGDIIITAPLKKVFSTHDWVLRLGGPYFGVHGYSPKMSGDLNGIFYANGPDIQQSYTVDAFENIHVYPLICQLLGIEVPKNIDGKTTILQSLIR